jgi:hypothetical protein
MTTVADSRSTADVFSNRIQTLFNTSFRLFSPILSPPQQSLTDFTFAHLWRSHRQSYNASKCVALDGISSFIIEGRFGTFTHTSTYFLTEA